MSQHNVGSGHVFNFVGSSIGFLSGVFNADLTQGLAKTVLFAFVGSVIGFLTTLLLKKLFKQK